MQRVAHGVLVRVAGVGRAWRRVVVALVLTLAVTFIGLSNVACDPSQPVTYDNRTDTTVTVFVNGKRNLSLDPMQKRTLEEIQFSEATFEARDMEGRVIYSESFTWEELEEADWHIVITGSVVPTPSPG